MFRRYLAAATVAACGFTSVAHAVTEDGDAGATSNGTADASVTIEETVKITGMTNLIGSFGTTELAAGTTISDTVCVFSNVGSTRNYSVTATGSGTTSAFTLAAQDAANSGVTLAYTVTFQDGNDGAPVGLTTNVAGNFDDGATSEACTDEGGTNATVTIEFAADDLMAAVADTYTGTLALAVAAP